MTAAVRDDDLFQAIRDALIETGEFDDVHYPCLPEQEGTTAGELKIAIIEPIDGDDRAEEFDDGGTTVRVARYRLTIRARDPDPQTCLRTVDRLFCVAVNMINGQQFNSATLIDPSRIRRSTWSKRKPPEQELVSIGELHYLIDGWTAHNTTD